MSEGDYHVVIEQIKSASRKILFVIISSLFFTIKRSL